MDDALVKKLKVPQAGKVAVINAPEGFLELIGRTEEDTRAAESEYGSYDYVQMFATGVADVEKWAPLALQAVKPDGWLWLSYPKGTSKIKTDLNRDRGWSVVQAAGWEGVALVSVDDTWSAMRYRPLGAAGKPRVTPAERRAAGIEPAAPLETPDDLQKALDANPTASASFGKLAPSHRKEYIGWILEAKRAETRSARVYKTIEKLECGHKRPSDKS
ncbi:YdeI/OmpD-associated family protein [Cohnella silvisoli]|uniref:YdeI/OmpD-associated family protein n=1 Tax=Cohnella silvisoli TaxID=2873699 RepID=A0ABV1KP42_9BACL|nr:YdeI/OmpD-associated family protein [Cohnella silvisoli]MCD9025663.1 YdeI/OmpD-associated family protein [Cohnella silvisoli]